MKEKQDTKQNQKKLGQIEEEKLSNSTIVLMLGTALFFDTFQLITSSSIILIGYISVMISFMAAATFVLWFKIKGIKFNSKAKLASLIAGVIVEMIPIIDVLPGWTVMVLAIVIIDKAEKIKRVLDSVPGGKKIIGKAEKAWGKNNGPGL